MKTDNEKRLEKEVEDLKMEVAALMLRVSMLENKSISQPQYITPIQPWYNPPHYKPAKVWCMT